MIERTPLRESIEPGNHFEAMDWMIVNDSWTGQPIGALGYIDDQIAVVTTFFADKDANRDGTVSVGEKMFSFFSLKGKAIAEVLNHAYADPKILMRDTSLRELRGKATVAFATGMIQEGIYKAYFSAQVSQAAAAIAGQMATGAIAQFMIKKGMEAAVQKVYEASIGG